MRQKHGGLMKINNSPRDIIYDPQLSHNSRLGCFVYLSLTDIVIVIAHSRRLNECFVGKKTVTSSSASLLGTFDLNLVETYVL